MLPVTKNSTATSHQAHPTVRHFSVSQDSKVFSSEVFNGFLVSAQLETQSAAPEQVTLDVYLLNNYRISVTVSSTLQTDDVLEVSRRIVWVARAAEGALRTRGTGYRGKPKVRRVF